LLPPELQQIAKSLGISIEDEEFRSPYVPLNKLRKNRDKKKLIRRRMVKSSRFKNR